MSTIEEVTSEAPNCPHCGDTGLVRVHGYEDYGVSFESEACEHCPAGFAQLEPEERASRGEPMNDESGFCNVCHVGYEAGYTGACQEPAAFLSDDQLASGDQRKCHGTVSLNEAIRMQRRRAECAEAKVEQLRETISAMSAEVDPIKRNQLACEALGDR